MYFNTTKKMNTYNYILAILSYAFLVRFRHKLYDAALNTKTSSRNKNVYTDSKPVKNFMFPNKSKYTTRRLGVNS